MPWVPRPRGPCNPSWPLMIRGTAPGAQANHPADRRNWKTESIKRRDFKMMAEMNANKECYCSKLI